MMVPLTLKLYPQEFWGMFGYLERMEIIWQVPLLEQSMAILVLVHYRESWNEIQLVKWHYRSPLRSYALSLPLPVGVALHRAMNDDTLNHFQQEFLGKLDLAITNYKRPLDLLHKYLC